MHKIVRVENQGVYRLKIKFQDGVEGSVDLSDMVGKGIFSAWKDYQKFSQVFIDPQSHALAWPGGMDLAPDALYEDIQRKRNTISTPPS